MLILIHAELFFWGKIKNETQCMPTLHGNNDLTQLVKGTVVILIVWSTMLSLSLYWNLQRETNRILQLAEVEAKANLSKDLAFRRWATKMGGLYVKVSSDSQPSPFMKHIKERDVITESGQKLTLYNPAIILRLLMETQEQLYGIKARITGEQFLNPANAPDDWEKKSLKIITRTLQDYSEVTELNGQPVLRYMQPMIMQEGCLKCHAWTNIKVGDLRGATDVAIPLAPYFNLEQQSRNALLMSHGGIWILGLGFIVFFAVRRVSYLKERQYHQNTLIKLKSAVEQSASGVIITDLKGKIEYVNPRFLEINGFSKEEVVGKTPSVIKSNQNPPEIYEQMWSNLKAGIEWRGEIKNRTKIGEIYWCSETISPIKNSQDEITHYLAVIEDISERKSAEATIQRLAFYDPLTELPNRRLLSERLQQAIVTSQREHSSIALLYLDLDRFKTINDTLGHLAGDQLLQESAKRFLDCLRESDTLARLGGDEFAILMPAPVHQEELSKVANRLLNCMQTPFQLGKQEVIVTTSIGISIYPTDTTDIQTLFSNADVAMYHAKGRGKNTYQFFSDGLNKAASERLLLEIGLRKALDNGQLYIEYQPKLDLSSNQIYGMEALLRWHHPEMGFIPPDKFIPLAEEIREIDKIGHWVLQQVCIQNKKWHNQGFKLIASVNISPLQFQAEDLRSRIDNILRDTDLAPEYLELEITESALMEEPDHTRQILEGLSTLGLSLSIDDFGTGYSSLSYLKQFPVNTLKIDRSFVNDIVIDEDDRAIASSVIALAKTMKLEVIAEGVEDLEQQSLLKELGCHHIQGYYLSRPLGTEKFIQFVTEKAQQVDI